MKTLVLATGLALAFAGLVHAQTATQSFPNRPLRQIVPFPPGGGVDITTRIVTAKWSEVLGQLILVENRPGAGGNVGADYVARAAPDGYTLFTCQIATHGISPALYVKLPFDHLRDFAPVSLIGTTPNVLVVNPSVPARSVQEFVEFVKANPGKYSYGSSGYGTSPHMTMELFKLTAGINLVHVPYKGGAPALVDVIGGQILGMFGNLPEQVPAIKSGKTRALAVSTRVRNPQIPDVPTVAESGYPDFEVTVWYGVCVPAAVPKPVLATLNATLVKTLNMPEVRARLAEAAVDATPMTQEEFLAFIRAETEKWARVVREAGVEKQ